jgi:enoyl-CoA hydratase/carnithine racemase
MSPKALLAFIERENRALFDAFLDLQTPILAAVNGPAIGACVTSATLCDGIIASSEATFSTPFARLGVTPEGCSSAMFPRLIGDAAERMLGPEGFKPTAQEAMGIGLVQWVVPHERLLDEARRVAGEWVAAGGGRTFQAGFSRQELKAVNAKESKQLAMAFLSPPFLMGQFRFLWRKRKRSMAMMFLAVRLTRPLWGLLL